jgi:glycosyltransferase involved in cell wall biosynthesis
MPQQLTVLRVITRLNIGGPAIHAILLSRYLQNDRFRSVLVSGKESATEGNLLDLAAREGVAPILVEELGRELSPFNDLATVRRLVALMRRERPQIVHTHMAKAGTTARLAARLAGVPIVVHTYHGHVFHSYFSPLKTRLFLSIERALGAVTDRIVAVGEKQRQELVQLRLAPPSKIIAIPLGLPLEPMLEAEQERGRLRAELGFDASCPLVGIVARLVPIKAHEVFLAAAARISQELPSARFLIVGDGERRAELEALTISLGLAERVRFLGWRRDMRSIYADLDVVALCSRNEGSPVAIIEAMAAGRPVVSTDVGGVGEVITDGESGFLVPAGDCEALSRAILLVLSEPERGRRMGNAARAAVYPRYSVGRLVSDLERLYLDLARQKGLVPACR